MRAGSDGFRARRRIEAQDENLVFVDATAFPRQTAQDRGSPGIEFEALACGQYRSIQRSDAGFEGEAAAHACGKIAIKVVDPVLAVGPAPVPLFDAIDGERVKFARIAERHQRAGETRRDLTYRLDFALRGKEGDGFRSADGAGAGKHRESGAGEESQRTQKHQCPF